MVSRGVVGVFLTACLVSASGVLASGGAPEAVSPGELDRLVRVRDSCPTFSWGGVSGADSLELEIYELGGATESDDEAEGELHRVVHRRLPGSARGWTPSLAECLSYGGRYVWTVRAVGEGIGGEWSEARLFEVAAAPSVSEVEAALEVLRRYVESGGEVAEEGGTEALERLVKARPAPERSLREAALERARLLARPRVDRPDPAETRELPSPIRGDEDALVGLAEKLGDVAPGIRALTGSGTVDDLHPPGVDLYAAGEFAGPFGVIGAASSDDPAGYGVTGIAYGTAGRAVYGRAPSTTGEVYGVIGVTASEEGRGVAGHANATSGGNYGVYGKSKSTAGSGVYGWVDATSGFNYGVYGRTDSTRGRGVAGWASSTSGEARGVVGQSDSSDGYGVYGLATATTGTNYGVRGESASTDGAGVVGFSAAGYGVEGNGSICDFRATGGGTNYCPFTGAHEVRLAEEAPADVDAGMVVSLTGRAELRPLANGRVALSSTLPTVTLSDRPYDPAVFGVLLFETELPADHWYPHREDERFAMANALGEGRVWVVDAGGPIRAGDFLTTSGVPGYAMRQDDDVLHSYTLGKAIETVDWEEVTETREHDGRVYKVYLLAVVYTSG